MSLSELRTAPRNGDGSNGTSAAVGLHHVARPTLRTVPPPLPSSPPPLPPAPLPASATVPLPPLAAVPLPPSDNDPSSLSGLLQLPGASLGDEPDVANAFAGMLARETSMHRLFRSIGKAGGSTRARVGRIVEQLKLVYQLKLVVQLEQLKHKKRIDQAQLNRWIVSTYKVVGFTVLSVIVLALLSYLGSTLFYWFSTSWLEPTVISPTDERVLQLSATLASQASTRDKLAADLADADRVIAMQAEFLDNARQALNEELADRKNELTALLALHHSYRSTRAEVSSNGRAFSDMSRRRIAAEYEAHLIDRDSAVTGSFQLSQIAAGNLTMAEKGVELDKRTAELERATESLSAIVAKQPATRHSFEVLRILADVRRAEVDLARARDNRKALAASLSRYEQLVRTITESPYLRAAERKDTIAFVPYDNLAKVKAGSPLYSCAVGLFFCHRVGQVVSVLSGEMSAKHPLHNTMVRGQSVQLQLSDQKTAERPVLFAGGRPLLF